MNEQLTIEPITPTIGAYLHIAADRVNDPGMADAILDALNRYNVVVFPQIHMSDAQFVELTGALGETHELGVTKDTSAASDMGIYRIALDKDDKTQLDYIRGNDYWHMDGTVYDAPGKATLLKCEGAPSTGGDTDFANLFAAYEALPEERKQALEELRVVHCLRAVGRKIYDEPTPEDFARWDSIFPPREHPIVWHQQDGRTSLVIGTTAETIAGMDDAAGAAFIDDLHDWCTSDRFTYRHKWQKGDVVIFNNPGLLHRSTPYDDASGRVLHRTTVKGHEAIA